MSAAPKKFIQIATRSGDEDNAPELYALDEAGRVWVFVAVGRYVTWRPLTSDREVPNG